MDKKRAILVGAGGFGSVWVSSFLPAFSKRLQVSAIVDVNPEVLNRAGEALQVDPQQRYRDIQTAFENAEADLCILVIQPHLRLEAVRLAASRGLAVLAEKPIADTWETSLEILGLTREKNTKMAICQNYPYTNRIATLKRVLTEGRYGRTSFIVARFAADYTIDTAGGAFRHQVPYAMIFEGAVHHLDQLRNLTESEAVRVSGVQWNPPWSTFGNPPTALFLVEMVNGVACQLELNHIAKGRQNGWHKEAYRVECEHASVTLDSDDKVRVYEHLGGGRMRSTEVEPVNETAEGHLRIIGDFLDWVDGGTVPETAVQDNIYTAALTFAAVEAVKTHTMVDVQAMIAAAGLPPLSPRFTAKKRIS